MQYDVATRIGRHEVTWWRTKQLRDDVTALAILVGTGCSIAPRMLAQTVRHRANRPRPSITGIRSTNSSPFDVPASIDVVPVAPDADGKPGIHISESLAGVQGLLACDQRAEVHAQHGADRRSRGFGAWSTFGIRGVRLYVDGIPATMPDGQGQILK